MQPLRIAHVAPVATSVPPQKSGSVQTMTSLLTEGLVERGHDVTLFAPGHSTTRAKLHATFPLGYREDQSMWPWEMYELLNLAVAPEYRRRGIARGLIHEMFVLRRGSIFLEVRESNHAARSLYQSMGFREIHIRPKYYDKPRESGIVMQFYSC